MQPSVTPEQFIQQFRTWLIDEVSDLYKIDLSCVTMVVVPQGTQNAFCDKAGGGAYVPSTYKPMLLKQMSFVLETDVVGGKTILVRADPKIANDIAKRMLAALILWHEHGHALGHPDRLKYGEKPEERAWKFEIVAVRLAFAKGMLARWGISADVVLQVMKDRRPTYDKDYESAAIRGEVIDDYEDLLKFVTNGV